MTPTSSVPFPSLDLALALGPHLETLNLPKEINVAFAVVCARSVLINFEREHPEDKRPREAIEAAERWLEEPTDANAQVAQSAASSASSAVESAVESAAESAASSAQLAAQSAAWSARSAQSAAWSVQSAAQSAASSAQNDEAEQE